MSSSNPPAVSENWMPAGAAAERLQKSKATLYRLVEVGEIQSKQEPRPGRKPERLFSRADIDRVLEQHVRISRRSAPIGTERALPPRPLLTAPAHQPTSAPRLVLRLDEAAAETGLPASYLAELVHSGQVAAIKRGAWYLSRRSLEQFIDNGFSQSSQMIESQ
jgi:hypothetical protein